LGIKKAGGFPAFFIVAALVLNGLQLPEGRDFYHKTVFGTRNPAFWIAAISGGIVLHTNDFYSIFAVVFYYYSGQ
jgi:hypothetical protein